MIDFSTTMDSPSVDDVTENIPKESTRSIARDYAPIFFVLATFSALLLLGLITSCYNYRMYQRIEQRRSSSGRYNHDTVYSPLTSVNEFDLH